MPKPLYITLLIVFPLVLCGIMGNGAVAFFTLVLILISSPIMWKIRKRCYFISEHFQALRTEAVFVVAEHNEVVNYAAEIRSQGSFELGASSTGEYAHLATFENNSAWNNQRDRNVAEYEPHMHNGSLQIVRSASGDHSEDQSARLHPQALRRRFLEPDRCSPVAHYGSVPAV